MIKRIDLLLEHSRPMPVDVRSQADIPGRPDSKTKQLNDLQTKFYRGRDKNSLFESAKITKVKPFAVRLLKAKGGVSRAKIIDFY